MTTIPATVRERIELPAPATARAGGSQAGNVTIQDVLAIIRRRMVLIVIVFMLLSALSVGGWISAYLYFPLWPAEAFVECISDKPKAMQLADEALDVKEFDRFILTQAHFATSPEVLMDALKTAEVRGTDWYKRTPSDDQLIDFLDLVKAAPQRGTNLLEVSVSTRSPDDPHKIVNQVVTVYLNRVKDHNTSEFRNEKETWEEELNTIVTQIADKDLQLARISKQLPPGFASTGQNPVALDYAVDRETANEYELMFRELQGLSNIYNQPGGVALSPQDTQLVALDPKVAYLSNTAFALEQQLEISSKDLGSNHRSVREIEKRLEVTNRQLTDEQQRRLTEILAYKRAEVNTAMLNAQHAWLKAQEKLTDTMAYLSDMDELVTQFVSLQEDIDLAKQNREVVASYIRELNRIIRERTAIRVELRERAMAPIQRSFPQVFLLPAGIALSLVFAVGIAILLEFIDTSIRTPQDIVRHLRIPLLGVVPDVDDEEVDIEQIETAVRDAPRSMYAEIFRTICTNLQFTATAAHQRSIVVTSPRPEDGKTAIACNLALMLAQGHRRVLLVDANFRKPAIHRFFKPRSNKGLSNILVGDGKAQDLVSPTDVANLSVLTSGPLPPNPAELMGSREMDEFIGEVSGQYDHVIFDSPPVLLASDTCVLASRTDGVILVCRAKVSSRGIGSRAASLLSRVNAHIFGAVLNAAQVARGGYFREQLRTFYDYRPDDDDISATLAHAPPKLERGGAEQEDS